MGRWVVSVNAGYGTYESSYAQSLAVMDTQTGVVKDFPDARVGERATQTFFSGLAFSADGTKVYASMASTTDPVGDAREETGNGVVVYGFADGVMTPQGFLKLPLVKLAAGRHTDYPADEESGDGDSVSGGDCGGDGSEGAAAGGGEPVGRGGADGCGDGGD